LNSDNRLLETRKWLDKHFVLLDIIDFRLWRSAMFQEKLPFHMFIIYQLVFHIN